MHDARGARLRIFRVQSMMRDDGQRTLLFDLDLAIEQLAVPFQRPVISGGADDA